MDHGQHFTFSCLGHCDLNPHLKKPDTSNTFLTLAEPHKPKQTLSTLSYKHDSMCHRKVCIGQKNDNSEPRIHPTGNFKFSESSKLSLWHF